MNSNGTPLPVIGQSAEVSVPPFNLMPALNVLPNIAVDLLIQLSIADPKPFGQQVTTNDSVGKIGHARIFIRPRQGTIQRCDASKYLGLKPVDGLTLQAISVYLGYGIPTPPHNQVASAYRIRSFSIPEAKSSCPPHSSILT